MATPAEGEIRWAEARDKRSPVLVVTRSDAVAVLGWTIVAPVTRTIRSHKTARVPDPVGTLRP